MLWTGINDQRDEHGVDVGGAAAFAQPGRWGYGHKNSNSDKFNLGVRLGPDFGSRVLLGPGN